MKIKLLFAALLFAFSFRAGAQIKVTGTVTKFQEPIEGATVVLYKNSEYEDQVVTGKKGKFEFDLELGHIYLFEARKAGHYAVTLNFSTEMPPERMEENPKGKFDISLDILEKFSGFNPAVLKKPIAQIRFYPEINNWDYDRNYFNLVKEDVGKFYSDVRKMLEEGIPPIVEAELPPVQRPKPAERVDLRGKIFLDDTIKRPLTNVVVVLQGEEGEMLQEATTDVTGFFAFRNLEANKGFVISIDKRKMNPGIKVLFLADERGNIIKRFSFNNEKFVLEVLPHDHHQGLASMHAEDPWLKIKDVKQDKKDSLIIVENIHYETGKWQVTPDAARTLDKIILVLKENPDIAIEINAHTDSRSAAQFNLDLSKKRADAAVAYIISKGIEAVRISGRGHGEAFLLNYCADGVECKEGQHAKNRRTEFKIVKKG